MSGAPIPSAFPGQALGSDGLPTEEYAPGASLWDFYAAHAMSALSFHPAAILREHAAGVALFAADVADAMLAERTKRLGL